MTLAIYRVVQEGLINALRHAQASQVDIEVRSNAQRILVTVADDGIGMTAARGRRRDTSACADWRSESRAWAAVQCRSPRAARRMPGG